VAPAWGPISFVIPLLLGMVAYALERVRRLAVALDAAADV